MIEEAQGSSTKAATVSGEGALRPAVTRGNAREPGPEGGVQPEMNERAQLLSQLRLLALRAGHEPLSTELEALLAVLDLDLGRIESGLEGLCSSDGLVRRSAAHLLSLKGKRLRPLLVTLCARLGSGEARPAVPLAIAVELVHSATLLHDDVVDLGTMRRGARTSRVLFGNAAAIFAGDWLLVEALRRVRSTGSTALLDRLLAVIEEMILAESLQLERRGRLEPDQQAYARIIEGKTASLFGWATLAGATAGGLEGAELEAAERFGRGLGRAFQLVDDALDLDGDETELKKSLAADLREGKLTHPLLVGLEREPALSRALGEVMELPEASAVPEALRRAVLAVLHRTGALEETYARARAEIEEAVACLRPVREGSARAVLESLARATVRRRS